jgi:hypothetical protein
MITTSLASVLPSPRCAPEACCTVHPECRSAIGSNMTPVRLKRWSSGALSGWGAGDNIHERLAMLLRCARLLAASCWSRWQTAPWALADDPGPAPAADNPVPPPGDDGQVASAAPATTTTPDGWVLTVTATDESQSPAAALTTASTSRDSIVGGTFHGSLIRPNNAADGHGDRSRRFPTDAMVNNQLHRWTSSIAPDESQCGCLPAHRRPLSGADRRESQLRRRVM